MDWSRDLDSLTLGLRKGRAEVDAWLDEEEEELELIGTRQSTCSPAKPVKRRAELTHSSRQMQQKSLMFDG